MKKIMFGMVIGAALAYVLDPQLGARRRDRIRAQLGKSPAVGIDDGPAIDIVMFDERTPVGVS